MRVALIVLSLFILTCSVRVKSERYDGHKVIKANVHSPEILQFILDSGMDVWSASLRDGLVDIRVSPHDLMVLESMKIPYQVSIPDIQAVIDDERSKNERLNVTADFFSAYQRYAAIVDYMKSLETTYSYAKFVANIGLSYEGRQIPALEIVTPSNETKKYTFFIDGGLHAREWIAPATVLYVATQLLSKYSSGDSTVRNILNKINFVIVPLSNPDGYEYTHTTTRLWRKNRRRNANGTYGVDLNRNYDDIYKGENIWCKFGASTNPNSDTYCGTAPFSEPETAAIRNYFLLTGSSTIGAIDFHSYGQLILRPYGNTQELPPNNAPLKTVGDGMRDAIRTSGGVTYTSEPAYALYLTSGTADAFYYIAMHAQSRMSYCIELRNTNSFVLDPSQIVPTGNENVAAVTYFGNWLLTHLPTN